MYNAHWIHSLPYSKFIELTLFYALPCKNMMLFPCVNLMSFYAFGNQAVKPCCKHFPRVCLSVIFYVYAKGCLLQAKS